MLEFYTVEAPEALHGKFEILYFNVPRPVKVFVKQHKDQFRLVIWVTEGQIFLKKHD